MILQNKSSLVRGASLIWASGFSPFSTIFPALGAFGGCRLDDRKVDSQLLVTQLKIIQC